MPDPGSEAPSRPEGEPLPADDESIAGRAEVSDEDVEDARDYWREHAPAKYRTLLDAGPGE